MRNERRLLVLHVTNGPLMLGFFAGQAAFFRSHGFDLEFVSSPGDGWAEFVASEAIPVHAVEMSRSITPLRDLASLYRLWRLIRRLRPAIVHAHTTKGGVLGMIAARLANAPVRIYHVHGMPRAHGRPRMIAGAVKSSLLRWSDRLAFSFSHRVLCVSPSIRRVALDLRLFPAEKAVVLARGTINGLDSSGRFNPAMVGSDAGRGVRSGLGIPVEARVLGFVGRVVREKGIAELAAAWRELRKRYPDLHLIMVGPIESHDPIPEQTKGELSCDSRVHMMGYIVDTPAYYAAMDVLALPTHREGFGYVLIEAASMGIPAVATRVPGCVDAVADGSTGMLVPPKDARALAEAVARYLDDPSLRREHGDAGRERVVREFGRQEVWEALLEEYRKLLAARLGAAPGPSSRTAASITSPVVETGGRPSSDYRSRGNL